MITLRKVILGLVFNFLFIFPLFAKEFVIIYTGDTHAMLYPCNCPLEPDGGIARRASLVKQLRKSYPDSLLLDSGNFFAGGLLDEYTQNVQLDIQRTLINLKALELMGYDAIAVGEDEFNFGKDFLLENTKKTNLNFLSCNLDNLGFLPYIVKEISGTKVGIIGVTSPLAVKKAGVLALQEPKEAVKKAVEDLKKQSVDAIILLSNLGYPQDIQLAQEVEGIDIIISRYSQVREEAFSFKKVGTCLIIRPIWQGRKLGKLTLEIKENKIIDYNVEELSVSDKIKDDPQILQILPACFSDYNCLKGTLSGKCENPGMNDARCVFTEPGKVDLLIISSKQCVVCNPEPVINYLKRIFGGLQVSYLYYPEAKALRLKKELDFKVLPTYLLDKGIEKENGFKQIKEHLELRGNYYLIKPEFTGFSYFLERQREKARLDLFISLYDKDTADILRVIKKYNPKVHFLAKEQDKRFYAANGNLEVEDNLRAVCVERYYPEFFLDYLICRAKTVESSWWEDCAARLDLDRIKICSRGQEGIILLKDNISLTNELKIMTGPVYLLENQQIFSSKGVPAEEELRIIFEERR
ncbi:MAG: metallophosphatase [Candidatus Omnitrophica bacterium]|nr:metallophosphatase [Candidatus Omnitrophota bacterium]